MNIEVLETIRNFSAIGILALLVYALIPIFKALGEWVSTRVKGNYSNYSIAKQVKKIQTNDLVHLTRDISELRKDFNTETRRTRDSIERLGERIARIEGILSIRKYNNNE